MHKTIRYTVIRSKAKFELGHIATEATQPTLTEDAYRELIDELQTRLYANHQHAMLIIFQGMDTSGKDGAIKHITAALDPHGYAVTAFKKPSAVEFAHDFLWKSNQFLPAKGQIGIYNRSYYEDVLITQVHPRILKNQGIRGNSKTRSLFWKKFWKTRHRDIFNYEAYLHRQGIEVIKIFLHISKSEQKRRLFNRFQNPKKIWKLSESDLKERAFWKKYQAVYSESIRLTASATCPWYIVPADNKDTARLWVSEIVLARLRKLKLQFPKKSRKECKVIAKLMTKLK